MLGRLSARYDQEFVADRFSWAAARIRVAAVRATTAAVRYYGE
jgi:hypothetical protein